jgi:hypothetical protein
MSFSSGVSGLKLWNRSVQTGLLAQPVTIVWRAVPHGHWIKCSKTVPGIASGAEIQPGLINWPHEWPASGFIAVPFLLPKRLTRLPDEVWNVVRLRAVRRLLTK